MSISTSDDLESDELDPELMDINCRLVDTGLAINHNVFARESTKPIIDLEYHNKDIISEQDETRQIETGIFNFIKNHIVTPR